jgi:hypothetical protein
MYLASEWQLLSQGQLNVILRYVGSDPALVAPVRLKLTGERGKVLRVKKADTRPAYAALRLAAADDAAFLRAAVRPLLGDFVDVPVGAHLPPPPSRAQEVVDVGEGFVAELAARSLRFGGRAVEFAPSASRAALLDDLLLDDGASLFVELKASPHPPPSFRRSPSGVSSQIQNF